MPKGNVIISSEDCPPFSIFSCSLRHLLSFATAYSNRAIFLESPDIAFVDFSTFVTLEIFDNPKRKELIESQPGPFLPLTVYGHLMNQSHSGKFKPKPRFNLSFVQEQEQEHEIYCIC